MLLGLPIDSATFSQMIHMYTSREDSSRRFSIYDLKDEFCNVVYEDLKDIHFDGENFCCIEGTNPDDHDPSSLIGVHTLPNGVSFLGCKDGGDWETPLFFILYIDPKYTLRAYIPKNGNVFNSYARTAYGSEDARTNNWPELADGDMAYTMTDAWRNALSIEFPDHIQEILQMDTVEGLGNLIQSWIDEKSFDWAAIRQELITNMVAVNPL